MLKDELFLAWRMFASGKIRSWLTMLGVFIGIASVVSLISLGFGLKHEVFEQFREIGTDKIFLMPGGGFGPTISSAKLLDSDIDTVEKVSGVKDTAKFTFKSDKIIFNKKQRYYLVNGFPTKEGSNVAIEALGADIVSGRIFETGDTNKALIGWKLSNDDNIFGRKITLGDKLEIKGEKFTVIGVFESRGNDGDDTSIYIPLDTFQRLYSQKSYDWIIIQTQQGQDNLELADRITERLRKFRGLKEGEEDFSVQTFDQLLESFGVVFTVINIVLAAIASISLVVGGVGIMNTMYTFVLERRKDIGIMKSVGATNSYIMRTFIMESALLGLAGGIIGVILGIGISKLVEYFVVEVLKYALLKPIFPLELIIGALIFSTFVGVLGGILPAYQASRLHPVEAIRK